MGLDGIQRYLNSKTGVQVAAIRVHCCRVEVTAPVLKNAVRTHLVLGSTAVSVGVVGLADHRQKSKRANPATNVLLPADAGCAGAQPGRTVDHFERLPQDRHLKAGGQHPALQEEIGRDHRRRAGANDLPPAELGLRRLY